MALRIGTLRSAQSLEGHIARFRLYESKRIAALPWSLLLAQMGASPLQNLSAGRTRCEGPDADASTML